MVSNVCQSWMSYNNFQDSNKSMKYDIHICISLIGEGVPGGTMRGGGSAVRFHDCTNNSAMTNMRDIKDMVSLLGIFF